MDRDNKKTVGSIALDLMSQEQENRDPIAQQRAMLSDYEKNFQDAFKRGQAQFNGNFYIVVITKKERLMENVIRNYFLVRESCPTPDHDQIVYKYDKAQDFVDLLWVVPCQHACETYRSRPLDVPKEEKALLMDILSFYDGSLLKKCKKLNGELKESSVSGSFNPEDFDDQENLVIQS